MSTCPLVSFSLYLCFLLCSRGLQFPNVPTENAGAIRLHEFATFECRASLTRRCGASSGPEVFAKEAMLWSLPGCDAFRVLPDVGHMIPATQTRGALATVMVEVSERVSFRFRSGFERTTAKANAKTAKAAEPAKPSASSTTRRRRAWVDPAPPPGFVWGFATTAVSPRSAEPLMAEDQDAYEVYEEEEEARDEDEEVSGVSMAAPGTEQLVHYLFTMQQERRPPLAGCWLIKSIIPVREHELVRSHHHAWAP